MARVLLENLVKTFDGVNTVVKNVNLEIKNQEFLVLVGPSGCGKTTTLRMIAGLEEISDGKIHIGDKIINEVHPKDRNIAMVFQNYALYPHMTVKENMSFGLKLRKHPKKVIEERVSEASEILGLEKLLQRKPKQLSGGQRQRVALGRAIVRHPDVFLMDEPLSNLDAKLRVQTRGEIKKLHNRLKATIIYVTHDQVEAMTLGDRIAIMCDGVLQQAEEPVTVYDKPANKFVGGFIGSPAMNFFEGIVKKNVDNYLFEGIEFSIELPSELNSEFEKVKHKPVLFGIRPSDLYDRTAIEWLGMDAPHIKSKVDFTEMMGAENFIHAKIGTQKIVIKVDPHIQVEENDSFEVFFNLKKFHLFDKETENIII
ncbi:MAG: sn-glycerol-3-phosphate ABC transporter ATP-binding protein UgpC [Candidatus Margulisbacteria bacterium]|nr:sn-glycerol-3-phosphate ABC transporter ATP-binding protein UgpC [Candidatus Margulisiibacteriota bacterium]